MKNKKSDYEQLYYDLEYELKKIKEKNKELEDIIEIYKNLSSKDNLKILLAKEIARRLNNKYD